MAATTDAAKHCPQCGAVLDPLAYASGQPFACGGCGARMKRNPQRAESGESTAVPTAVDGVLLEIVEDLLIKMIAGLFRFIFVKVPTELYRAVLRWFPTLVQMLRIGGLLMFWLAAALGPCVVMLQFSGRAFENWPRIPVPSMYEMHSEIWQAVVGSYTVLALTGSLWGVLYLRRRRKTIRAARDAQ